MLKRLPWIVLVVLLSLKIWSLEQQVQQAQSPSVQQTLLASEQTETSFNKETPSKETPAPSENMEETPQFQSVAEHKKYMYELQQSLLEPETPSETSTESESTFTEEPVPQQEIAPELESSPEPEIIPEAKTIPQPEAEIVPEENIQKVFYIGNVNTRKFHKSTCHYLPDEQNQVKLDSLEAAANGNFIPCQRCKPR